MDVWKRPFSQPKSSNHWLKPPQQQWIDPQEALIGISMTQYQPSGYHLISPDFRVTAYQAIVD